MSVFANFDRCKTWLGITPTLWWNDDFPSLDIGIAFEQCISEMALAGFQGCSIGHKYPTDPATLRNALDLRGLRVSEPWVSTYFTIEGMREKTIQETRNQLRFLDDVEGASDDPRRADLVVAELGGAVHPLPVDLFANAPNFDERQWDQLVSGIDEIGRIASEEGRNLCYHPHLGTGVMKTEAIETLFDRTNHAYVHMLLDTAHVTAGCSSGAEIDTGVALAIARKYVKRIKHVHLKDIREGAFAKMKQEGLSFEQGVVEGIFTVPGDGSISTLPDILHLLADEGFTGWLMTEAEQAPARDEPLIYARKAREFFRQHIGW